MGDRCDQFFNPFLNPIPNAKGELGPISEAGQVDAVDPFAVSSIVKISAIDQGIPIQGY